MHAEPSGLRGAQVGNLWSMDIGVSEYCIWSVFFFFKLKKLLCTYFVEERASFLHTVTGIYRLEYFRGITLMRFVR